LDDKLTEVVVYGKEGCHLCEKVIAALERIRVEKPLEVSTRDITTNPQLFERYKNIIPVVEVNGKIRLAGSTLANQQTLENVLRRTLLPQHP